MIFEAIYSVTAKQDDVILSSMKGSVQQELKCYKYPPCVILIGTIKF